MKSKSRNPQGPARATAKSSDHRDVAQTALPSLILPSVESALQDQPMSIISSRSSSPQSPSFSPTRVETPDDAVLGSVVNPVDTAMDRSTQSGEEWKTIGDYRIPNVLWATDELVSFIPEDVYEYLCALLISWEPGTEYMDTLHEILKDKRVCKWILDPPDEVRITYNDGTSCTMVNVFDVVENFMSREDSFEVTKKLLLAAGTYQHSQSKWVRVWSKARSCHDWGEAQNLLSDALFALPLSVFALDTEKLPFVAAGKVVIAEQLLHHFHQAFADGGNICDRCINYEPWQLRRRFMQILESFSDEKSGEFDVDPKFYELSNEIVEGAEENLFSERENARLLELEKSEANDDRYRQVISKLSGLAPGEVDGRLGYLLSLNKGTSHYCKYKSNANLLSMVYLFFFRNKSTILRDYLQIASVPTL